MSRENLQQRVERRLQEALPDYRRYDTETARRRKQPPQPGDLYVLPETRDFPLQWAVIERDVEAERLLLIPADSHPLIGSTDLAVPTEAPSGALNLRCSFAVWLRSKNLDSAHQTGFLEDQILDQVRSKLTEIQSGSLRSSSRQRMVDIEPEYQDWAEEVLAKAASVLADQRMQPEGIEEPLTLGPTSWSAEALFEEALEVSSTGEPMELRVRIGAEGETDSEYLDQLTLQLLSEIQELSVENVALVRGTEIPTGARSAEAVEVGSLSVALRPAFLVQLLELLWEWTARESSREVTIESTGGREGRRGQERPQGADDLRSLLEQLRTLMRKKADD